LLRLLLLLLLGICLCMSMKVLLRVLMCKVVLKKVGSGRFLERGRRSMGGQAA